MDTTAYLTRQGWRGDGHGLHPSGHGIKKPLLVSKKMNTLGVGKKAHDVHADQWWARAFDETLRSINGEKTVKASVVSSDATPTQSGVSASKWSGNGGLYGNFIRGDGLEGTIEAKEKLVEDYRFNHGLSIEKGRRKLEGKAAKKGLEQQGGDAQSRDASASRAGSTLKTEPLTASDQQAETVSQDTLPLQGALKRKEVLAVTNGCSFDASPSYSTVHTQTMAGNVDYGGAVGTDRSRAVDDASEVAPESIQVSERRRRVKQRTLEREISKKDSIRTQVLSADNSEQKVKRRKKRRKDADK
ncbi:MAG: hypothetical protein LQ338_003595 [Usnochroma carphineum]|nr:MAG: hypothetical protein LQ338_003595 [Usnochroma carphineum]